MLVFEWNFLGLSSETKPLNNEKVIDGSTFYECDTSSFFIYYNGEWYKQTFVTDDGINAYLYKFLMRKMFKNAFDTNITKTHVYNPEISNNISFTTVLPSNITEMKMYGDTEQQTYSGKNLLNLPDTVHTENQIRWTVSNSIHAVGQGTTASNAGSYLNTATTINFDITGDFTFSISQAITAPLYIRFYSSSNANLGQIAISTGTTSKTGTIPSGAVSYRILLAPTPNTTYDIDIYLQLEKSSQPSAIEPYVGGIPSPNPDYPQEVQTVTGEQTVSVTGKNLFSGYTKGINLNPINGSQTTSSVSACSDYIPLSITSTKEAIISGLPNNLYNLVAAYNSDKVFLGRTGAGNISERLLNVSAFSGGTPQGTGDIAFLRVAVYQNTNVPGVIDDIDNAKIQLENGSTASPFEQYHAQIYPISLGTIELCKIGDRQDYIYKSGDEWYMHKEIGKKEILSVDGLYSSAGAGYIGAQVNVPEMLSNSRRNGYCNRFTPINSPSGATTEGITFGAGNQTIYMVLKDSRMESSTGANWAAWLSSNNTTAYYPLATPTDTQITDTALISSLDSIMSYTFPIGLNYITVSASNLPALLKLTITEKE